MIGSFLLTSTEVSTPLTAKKSKKKTLEKSRIDNQKNIKNLHLFTKDLHLEETTVIEIDSE